MIYSFVFQANIHKLRTRSKTTIVGSKKTKDERAILLHLKKILLPLDKPTAPYRRCFFYPIMNKPDLLEKFVQTLHAKYPKRQELVSIIENTLNIERESASRRLSGRVQFTIRELGTLAFELNISLDNLLQPEEYNSVPFVMQGPFTAHSIDVLVEQMKQKVSKLENICHTVTEIGSIFNALPAEFYIPYPSLAKFMLFKWGHYFIGSGEFAKYESWVVPKSILDIHDRIMSIRVKYKRIICFWDISLVWNIVKDIEYFLKIHSISPKDVKMLKQDILDMLNDVESMAKGSNKKNMGPDIKFYVSSVHMGMTYSYFFSDVSCASSFNTYFMRSIFLENQETCLRVRNWIISMKKVSTLISGSGEKERILFFEEQRKIVNNIPVS